MADLKAFKPSLNPSKGTPTDRRQTSCKVCRHGIFESQTRVWSRRPLGLVHTECAPVEVGRG